MRNIKKLVAVLCVFKFGALGLGALAMLHLAGSTAAQQMTETLFNVFPDADSVEPAPKELARLAGAIRQAKVPRECPLGELTIYTPKGNDTFQQALSDARRDAVLAALERLGLGVAGRLFVNEVQGSAGKFDVGYSGARDDKPPTLTTTSQPKKGSKVKAGQTITVTMVARDDADHLQTGIESIRLIALSDGGRDVAPTPMRYGPCSDPREKRVVATYVVPDNPPPIIRLRAVARDHANREDFDVAEFPTGDWYGTFGWRHICHGGGGSDDTRGTGDLTLDYDGQGNLTGTLAGTVPERTMTQSGCSSYSLLTPGTFRAKLLGSYTPEPARFSVQATEVQTTLGRASISCRGSYTFEQAYFTVYETPMFRDAFRDLRRQQDGSWKLIPDGESNTSTGGATCTTTYSLTLRQAQN
jgi:hypothetical protein